MYNVLMGLVDFPLARMFVLAGIIFLLIAVLGKIEGKIEPGNLGRIGAAILGTIMTGVGITMQMVETHDFYSSRLPINMMPVSGSMAPSAAPPTGASMITIVSGTFGRSCPQRNGNATTLLAQGCNGAAQCEVKLDPAQFTDTTLGNCGKEFVAEWKCSNDVTQYSITLPALTEPNTPLRIRCGH